MREPIQKTILCPILQKRLEIVNKGSLMDSFHYSLHTVSPKTPEQPTVPKNSCPVKIEKRLSEFLSPIVPRILFPEIPFVSEGSPIQKKKNKEKGKKKRKSEKKITIRELSNRKSKKIIPLQPIPDEPSPIVDEPPKMVSHVWTDIYISDDETPDEYTF
jgi:hypothetical protein